MAATPFQPSVRLCSCYCCLQLCDRPVGQGYRGSPAIQVRKGLGVMFGDWKTGDGRGGESSFGTKYFSDENFIVRHSAPGVLTMANAGVHTNSSIFMVTLATQPHLGEGSEADQGTGWGASSSCATVWSHAATSENGMGGVLIFYC